MPKKSLPPLPPLSRDQKQFLDKIKALRQKHPTPLSRCVDQTKADTEAYYRTAPVGAVAVVRHTQGHLLRYDITEIEGRTPRTGRVHIRNAGSFYMKSGANCFHPTGQTSLVVPTDAVLAWAKEHPMGEMDIATGRHD